MANRVGNVLADLGVEMEGRVLIALPDSIEFVAIWFGIAKIGAVITMVHGGFGGTSGCHSDKNVKSILPVARLFIAESYRISEMRPD